MRKASRQAEVQTKLVGEQAGRSAGEGGRPHRRRVMRMRRTGRAGRTTAPAPLPPSSGRPPSTRPAVRRGHADGRRRRRSREIQRATTGGQALPSERAGVHGAAVRRRLRRRARPRRRERRQPQQPPQRPGVHLPQPRLLRARPVPAGHRRGPPPARPRAHPHDPAGRRPCSAARCSVPDVTTSGSPPAVQRLGIQDALDYFADKANNIPGFRMLTLILGLQPDQHAQRRPHRGQLPAGADRADPRRRADHPGARQPRRDQQGRRRGWSRRSPRSATSAATIVDGARDASSTR